ncbi:DUF1150 family protein [Devosia sp. XK-2]|uniref:DUF1150 family protein n=1 Tax=Devosia sp. XK-2 TaxID=3126689 RepID=UPI0030D5BFE4
MMDKRNSEAAMDAANPLKDLTRAQFAALGGDAVAYIRPVSGLMLSGLIADAQFDSTTLYQLVMSADGTPLMVADSTEAVSEWLGEQNIGVATLH